MNRRPRGIPKLALAGIALAFGAALAVGAFAAFGGGSSTTTVAAAPAAFAAPPDRAFAAPPDQAFLQRFQDCMRAHGVEVPQHGHPPPPGLRKGVHRPSPKALRAFHACGRYLPQRPPGIPPPGPPGVRGALPGVPPPPLRP